MILKNLDSTNDIIVTEYDIDFHIVNSQSDISFQSLTSCDAIVFRTDYINYLKTQIQKIRKSDNPALYLKPIYVSSKRAFLRLDKNVDGYIGDSELEGIEEEVSNLLKRIEALKSFTFPQDASFHQRNFIKLSQYLFTRNIKLEASRSRRAHIGYYYKFIDYLVPDLELHQFLDELNRMKERGYITTELVENVSLCKSCSSSYLHFIETCHRCKSVDIEAESLIHHFRCAYIGPESDFKQNDDLVCPKCDKMLRHIGVDYDKPSEIVHCNTCNHQSQQSAIIANCVDCGHSNELANLHTKKMYNVQLTEQGQNLAINPKSLFAEIELNKQEKIELEIEPDLFDLFSRQESLKQYAKKLGSYIIDIEYSRTIIERLTASETSTFKLEFKKILINYLEEIDLFCSIDATNYRLLLISKKDQYIEDMVKALEYNIDKILNDNFNDPQHQLQIKSTKL